MWVDEYAHIYSNHDYEIRISEQIRNKEILNRNINLLDNVCNKLIYTNEKKHRKNNIKKQNYK